MRYGKVSITNILSQPGLSTRKDRDYDKEVKNSISNDRVKISAEYYNGIEQIFQKRADSK